MAYPINHPTTIKHPSFYSLHTITMVVLGDPFYLLESLPKCIGVVVLRPNSSQPPTLFPSKALGCQFQLGQHHPTCSSIPLCTMVMCIIDELIWANKITKLTNGELTFEVGISLWSQRQWSWGIGECYLVSGEQWR